MTTNIIEVKPRGLWDALQWWRFVEKYRWSDLRRRAPVSIDPAQLLGWRWNRLHKGGELLVRVGDFVEEIPLPEVPPELSRVSPVDMLPSINPLRDVKDYLPFSPGIWSLLVVAVWVLIVGAAVYHTPRPLHNQTLVISFALLPILMSVAGTVSFRIGLRRITSGRLRSVLRAEWAIYMGANVMLLCGLLEFAWSHFLR